MKRVIVIGTTGAGKSTLAQQLATTLKLAYIDLDDIHHLPGPGWQERPKEDFRRFLAEVASGEKWVLAGNYSSKSQDITWPRADTIIWLDMPFWLNFWQLLKRTLRRSYTGEPICNGNRETLRKALFSRDSILLWFLKTWHKNRKKYGNRFESLSDHYPHLRFIRLRSYAESREFVEALDKTGK